jgi:outer membrane protein OmpA-like peptidoglycan-associated protein
MAGFWHHHRAGRLSAAFVLALLAVAALPALGLAQDTMVSRDEFIRQLGGQEPTAPAPGGMRLRGVAGIKGTVQTAPVAKEVALLIRFKYDSTEMADEFSRRQLREAGEALSSRELRGLAFEIGGHTDGQGSDAYNLELSLRRAQAVKDALCRGYAVDCGTLRVKGYGKSTPVAGNDDEAGRARNRRVVFKRVE